MSVAAKNLKRKLEDSSDSTTTPSGDSLLRVSAPRLLGDEHSNSISAENLENPISIPGTRASSPNATHDPPTRPLRVSRNFDPNASIVLIGIHGTGKSTLGVIAATALRRRLINANQFFLQNTGLSRAAFKKQHGAYELRVREQQVLRAILMENEKDCVIACGPGCIEMEGKVLLKEYALTHPIIHVVREAESIQAYTRIEDPTKIRRLLTVCEPMYRSCSAFEYYNISESNTATSLLNSDSKSFPIKGSPTTRFLALKHVELDFLQFIYSVVGHGKPLDEYDVLNPPRLSVTEQQLQSYSLAVPLSKLVDGTMCAEQLDPSVDAIELIVDKHNVPDSRLQGPSFKSTITRHFALLRRKTSVPIIFSVSRRDISNADGSNIAREETEENDYFDLLHHGLRLAADAVVVNIDEDSDEIRELVTMRGSTKIFGCYYFSVPGGWKSTGRLEKYNKARSLGCSMVRLVQKGGDMRDNFDVWDFRHQISDSGDESRPQLIAFNTGHAGRMSCIFNQILTTIVPPSVAEDVPESHRTVITSQEAQKALYSSFFLDQMHFYIYGATVAFSLSPTMYEAAFRALGMPHRFQIKQSPSLQDLQVLSADPNFGGCAIALPYKTEVIALLHSMSPHAMAIGAVNTIIPIRALYNGELPEGFDYRLQRNRSGPIKALYGENTDWIGMRTVINRRLSPANAITPYTTGLIIGAGGMARAAIYAMKQLGLQNIFVWNRTYGNADKLASHYNNQVDRSRAEESHNQSTGIPCFPQASGKITVTPIKSMSDPWPAGYRNPTIIVSCVPTHSIGGKPPANITIPPQWLRSPTGGVVVELAYNPQVTPLVEQIRKEAHRGWVAVEWLEILPEQGFAQFEIFTGRRAPRQLMRKAL